MPEFPVWVVGTPGILTPSNQVTTRAALAWRRIQAKPSSVAFRTSTTTLAAQTVRIESDNRPSMMESASGTAPERKVVIYGVRGHTTQADTDMKEGYTFNLTPGDKYRIQDIILVPGEIQAICESTR